MQDPVSPGVPALELNDVGYDVPVLRRRNANGNRSPFDKALAGGGLHDSRAWCDKLAVGTLG